MQNLTSVSLYDSVSEEVNNIMSVNIQLLNSIKIDFKDSILLSNTYHQQYLHLSFNSTAVWSLFNSNPLLKHPFLIVLIIFLFSHAPLPGTDFPTCQMNELMDYITCACENCV